MRRIAATVLFLSFFPCGLPAARLFLRDGTVIDGQFLSGSPQTIVFQDENGMRRRFEVTQIQSIDFGPVATGADRSARDVYGQEYPSGQYNNQRPQYTNQPPAGAYNNGPYNNGPQYAVLQPGTQISVRTDQDINTQNAEQGRSYPASIAQDVIGSDGRIVIPRGAPATLVVRQITEGSQLSGPGLVLDLDSVRVNGRHYRVATADLQAGNQGIGKNRRTAEMVGGGAVLGTLLGAIAGGGKGAAIGAIAGGVAGGGVQVLTKGHEIRVPAETVLNFRLDQPLELREMR